MPTFLRGVSIHPSHQTQHPISFDGQFSDITPFTHNATVSLDFPTIISLATTRFFRKCFATAQAGHTAILIGGFRDKPSNRKIRNRLSRISVAAHHHAHILLTFPTRDRPTIGPTTPTRAASTHTDRTPPKDLGNCLLDTFTVGGSQPTRTGKDTGRQPPGGACG